MPPVHMGFQMSSPPQPTMYLAPMRPHMTPGKCGCAHCPDCQNHDQTGTEEQPHGWRQCIRNSRGHPPRQGQKPMSVPQDRATVGPSKSARKAAKWPSRAQRRQGETVKRICTWSIIEGSRVNGPPSRTAISSAVSDASHASAASSHSRLLSAGSAPYCSSKRAGASNRAAGARNQAQRS